MLKPYQTIIILCLGARFPHVRFFAPREVHKKKMLEINYTCPSVSFFVTSGPLVVIKNSIRIFGPFGGQINCKYRKFWTLAPRLLCGVAIYYVHALQMGVSFLCHVSHCAVYIKY